MTNWPERALDAMGSVSRGRSRHRPRNDPSLYGGPYPFIQTGDVKHAGLYVTDHEQTYSELGLTQSRLWPVGTLCITIAANIADTAILSYPACFPDSVIGFIADPEVADVRFVKYFFDTVQSRYKNISGGAAQDNLSQAKLLSYPVPCPDLAVQQRIAVLLSSYDDLIENNRRRMALLEESVHLLYREWFCRLRFPGYERVRVVDRVPEGWRQVGFGDLVETLTDRVEPAAVEPATPYIGLEHIPRKSIAQVEWGTASDVASSKLRFARGDILFGKIRPYFHKVSVAPIDGITSSDTIVMRAASPDVRGLAIAVAASELFVEHSFQTAKVGSKMPRANWTSMAQFGVLLPSATVLSEFNEFVCERVALIERLVFQNRRLAEARDALLPRLMNGSIAV